LMIERSSRRSAVSTLSDAMVQCRLRSLLQLGQEYKRRFQAMRGIIMIFEGHGRSREYQGLDDRRTPSPERGSDPSLARREASKELTSGRDGDVGPRPSSALPQLGGEPPPLAKKRGERYCGTCYWGK
jgi:hypothetical protein